MPWRPSFLPGRDRTVWSRQRARVRTAGFMLRQAGPAALVRSRRTGRAWGPSAEASFAAVAEDMWRSAAAELGAEMERISPRILEFRRGDARARVSGTMTTSLVDRVAAELALDKPLVLELLSRSGLPVPEFAALDASDLAGAAAFLARTRGPVVVKPDGGQGGAGVVGHVSSPAQLERALLSVSRYGRRLVLERQIEGDSYRLLFLDGRLLDVIHRTPLRLAGDGRSTVAELMQTEGDRRRRAGAEARGYKALELDLDTVCTLEQAGLRLDSVPAAGASVLVKTATNYSGPELSRTAPGSLCQEVVDAARAAADIVGLRLAGVDVVTAAPARALAESGGVILEVNGPGLNHHYNVADRERATPVAVPILAALLGLPPGPAWPPAAGSGGAAV